MSFNDPAQTDIAASAVVNNAHAHRNCCAHRPSVRALASNCIPQYHAWDRGRRDRSGFRKCRGHWLQRTSRHSLLEMKITTLQSEAEDERC